MCVLCRTTPSFSATLASSLSHESFELTNFTTAPHSSGPAILKFTARAQQSRSVTSSLGPASSPRSSARFVTGPSENWEKTSSEQRPRGLCPTRLRFWREALQRRAHGSSRTRTVHDLEPAVKMKFSHSIQFNAVPDWSANYIAYSNLKKL